MGMVLLQRTEKARASDPPRGITVRCTTQMRLTVSTLTTTLGIVSAAVGLDDLPRAVDRHARPDDRGGAVISRVQEAHKALVLDGAVAVRFHSLDLAQKLVAAAPRPQTPLLMSAAAMPICGRMVGTERRHLRKGDRAVGLVGRAVVVQLVVKANISRVAIDFLLPPKAALKGPYLRRAVW